MRLLCPWDFPGKNTGVGCHFFPKEIFPTQGLNPLTGRFFTPDPPGRANIRWEKVNGQTAELGEHTSHSQGREKTKQNKTKERFGVHSKILSPIWGLFLSHILKPVWSSKICDCHLVTCCGVYIYDLTDP